MTTATETTIDPVEARTELMQRLVSIGTDQLWATRNQLLAWSKDPDPSLREAGRSWAAALGAMLIIAREPDADVPKLLKQVHALSRAGEESLLAFVESQANKAAGAGGMGMVGLRATKTIRPVVDPAVAGLFQELVETCAVGRKAIRLNSEPLSNEFARRMAAIDARGLELGVIAEEPEGANDAGDR